MYREELKFEPFSVLYTLVMIEYMIEFLKCLCNSI
jgi:hypothetical protein